MPKRARGFTLLELLVVIAIIGLLATVASVAFRHSLANARDLHRLADMRQMQNVLEIFREAKGEYPPSSHATALGSADMRQLCQGGFKSACGVGERVYLAAVPLAPASADGDCTADENSYMYSYTGGEVYTLTFCLGGTTGSYVPGRYQVLPESMIPVSD